MREIAQGLQVYFKKDRSFRNIVFFPDGACRYYDDGEMLFEAISDEAIFILTEKAENMIALYPDFSEPVSLNSIADGFRWLCGTVGDDGLPVVTELFISTFNDTLEAVVLGARAEGPYRCVGELFHVVYKEYLDHIKTFCMFVESIAAEASGLADEGQRGVAKAFMESAEEWGKQYRKKCSVRHADGSVRVETRPIRNFLQLLTFECLQMKQARKAIKECANCGRLFIPLGRVDAIYCPCQAPGYPGKTCAEIGAQLRRAEKRRSDPKEHDHHNNTCRLYNIVRRAKENGDSEDMIAYYQRQIDDEMTKYFDGK